MRERESGARGSVGMSKRMCVSCESDRANLVRAEVRACVKYRVCDGECRVRLAGVCEHEERTACRIADLRREHEEARATKIERAACPCRGNGVGEARTGIRSCKLCVPILCKSLISSGCM